MLPIYLDDVENMIALVSFILSYLFVASKKEWLLFIPLFISFICILLLVNPSWYMAYTSNIRHDNMFKFISMAVVLIVLWSAMILDIKKEEENESKSKYQNVMCNIAVICMSIVIVQIYLVVVSKMSIYIDITFAILMVCSAILALLSFIFDDEKVYQSIVISDLSIYTLFVLYYLFTLVSGVMKKNVQIQNRNNVLNLQPLPTSKKMV